MREHLRSDQPSPEWEAVHRQIALRRHYVTHHLSMPLKESIDSKTTPARFFSGPGSRVMEGSYISEDSQIGAHCYIGYRCMVTRATIGNFVSIANNCTIGPGEHSPDRISTSSVFYDDAWEDLTSAPCTIGHDAWIAEGSIIRRGVTVGIGAVVGANSFVNKDVPAFAVVAGSPARVIRMRFPEQTISAILASEWWSLPLAEAKKKVAELEASRGWLE